MTDPNYWPDTMPFAGKSKHCPPCTNDWRCRQGRCPERKTPEPAADLDLQSWAAEAASWITTVRGGLLFGAALILVGLAAIGVFAWPWVVAK